MAEVVWRDETTGPAGQVAWPAGTVPGDLAVLTISGRTAGYRAGYRSLLLPGWAGGWTAWVYSGVLRPAGFVQVWWKVVAAGDLAGPVDVTDGGRLAYQGVLAVASGAVSLVGQVSRRGRVSVPQGGGAFFAGVGTVPPFTEPTTRAWSWDVFHAAVVAQGVGASGEVGVASSGSIIFGDSPRLVAAAVVPVPGPAAPVVIAPDAGMDVGGPDVRLVFVHQSAVPGGRQDAFQVRLRPVGSSQWLWVTADGSLTPTQTIVQLATGEVVARGLTLDTEYEFEVLTREKGDWSPPSPRRTFTPMTPPTVTITGPASPVVDDLSPTSTWTADAGKGVIEAWRHRVLDGTVVLDDTGWQAGNPGRYTVPVLDWARGGSYDVEVTVRQTGGVASEPVVRPLVIDWTSPPAPTVTGHDHRPGVQVVVAGTPDARVDLERTVDGGVSWHALPAGSHIPGQGVLVAHDVTAPFRVPVKYRARVRVLLEGKDIPSDWAESGLVASTDRGSYLLDPAEGLAGALAVWILADGERGVVQEGSVAYPLNGTVGTADYGAVQGQSGEITLGTATTQEAAAVNGLLTRGSVLVLRYPPDRDGTVESDVGVLVFLPVPGSVRMTRPVDNVNLARRNITFNWITAERTHQWL